MEGGKIPIWPVDSTSSPRRMCLLFGEARWYLWFQEENKQSISALRRDLLLLHQNGDLELLRGKDHPPTGTYITALHEGKMMRGCVCSPQQKSEDNSKSNTKFLNVIDVDEGKRIQLPLNQVRVLPQEMKSVPCQAVRCDIGLDCKEQFEWPSQINEMLHKALSKAYLFVENTSNRPGSIPTISAKVTICNPTTGQTMSIQKWLMEMFSPHLDLCSMDEYKPYPVGVSADMAQSMGLLQQQIFGMNLQALPPPCGSPNQNLPQRFPPSLPSNMPPQYMPSISPGVPNGMHPRPPIQMMPPSLTNGMFSRPNGPPIQMMPHPARMPSNQMPPNRMPPNQMPPNQMRQYQIAPNGMPYNPMPPYQMPSNVMPHGSHQMMPPNFVPQFSVPTPPGSTVSATMVSFQYTQPAGPKQASHRARSLTGESIYLSGEDKSIVPKSSSNTSLSSAGCDPSVVYESDCDESKDSCSTVAVDLDGGTVSSSSAVSINSSLNPHVPAYVPRQQCVQSKGSDLLKRKEKSDEHATSLLSSAKTSEKIKASQSAGKEKLNEAASSLSTKKEDGVDRPCSPSLPCGRGSRRKPRITDSDSSSSSLSVEASPFTPMSKSVSNPGVSSVSKPVASTVTKPGSPSVSKPGASSVSKKGASTVSKPSASTVSKPGSPSVSKPGASSVGKQEGICSTTGQIRKEPESEPDSDVMAGSSCNYPKGKDVELVLVVRHWKVGDKVSAFMARVWNPSCFEVNIVDQYSSLLSRIEEEMSSFYRQNQITISSKQQAQALCGHFCACYDADEGFWFRAEVEEWFPDDSVTPLKVWAVDYGGVSRVDLSCVQPLSTEMACTSPIMVTFCCMKNILPFTDYGVWPEAHLNRVKELLPDNEMLYLRIDGPMSKENIWPVSVFNDADCSMESVNEKLVAEGCAYYVGMQPERQLSEECNIFEDAEDPMEEAYRIGGDNYDYDDEDACVAVSGRKPTDEIGICWFYNKNGYCYKKYCDLKHVKLDPDGHSIAKEELHTRSFEEIDESVLAPGKRIKLTVTRILTVNHFIARMHVEKGTPGVTSRETLKSVLENLNSPEMKRSLKAFTEFPADGEIVLFKDKTGYFYRGRVVGSDHMDDNLYEVLNVDTGYLSQVHLQDLRRVDPAFLHHPFQAIECWLADVAPTQSDREWTKTCNMILADLVRDQKLIATIVRSAPWGIEVNLMDKQGQDIAVVLKELGVVKSCPMRHLPVTHSQHFPG